MVSADGGKADWDWHILREIRNAIRCKRQFRSPHLSGITGSIEQRRPPFWLERGVGAAALCVQWTGGTGGRPWVGHSSRSHPKGNRPGRHARTGRIVGRKHSV